jgi:hypothetical protein
MAEEASRAYPNDLEVLLSVGRMLLAHGQLQMAKRHLLCAAKLAAEPRAPRLLGEVLLRQGDAKRAVRALQRAIQLGATDEETQGWYESASAYVPVQAEQGREAVARSVDDGFSGEIIADEDSDDDAPTMIASNQPDAVMAMVQEAEAQTRQHQVPQMPTAASGRSPRPERPAIPRDDEATDFVQLTQIAQDGAPTRVASDVPREITKAPLPGGPPAAKPSAPKIVDESTAIMDEADIAQLNEIEARRSGKIKDETTDRVDEPPEERKAPLSGPARSEPARSEPARSEPARSEPARSEPKKKAKIIDEDSDEAWQMAVQKAPAEESPPSIPSKSSQGPPKSTTKSKNRTGAYIGSAAAAILVTLFAGVRTGRLPEVAQHLPPWLSGAEESAQVAPTADPAAADTQPEEQPPANQGAEPEPKATDGAENSDDGGEPEAKTPEDPKSDAEPEPKKTADPAPEKPKPRPVVVYPRPRPKPKPAAPPPPAAPAPAPAPDPGAPETPVWLGDPERN